MPLANFHPAIQRWFEKTFAAPSPPQAAGWPAIQRGGDTLICAPTGSGKTLTAFLACIDSLFRQGLDGTLDDRTQVVYVSPLKALSNDVKKNLKEPLEGICAAAHELGLVAPEIRVLVRTGDTLASERAAMARRPPHILVTTPESLFILLTARKSREALRAVRTVIVDEIHALARDKRGAHLALSLERLDALCRHGFTAEGAENSENSEDSLLRDSSNSAFSSAKTPVPPCTAGVSPAFAAGRRDAGGTTDRPQRIGLSATQRPVELVAHFLVGAERLGPDGSPNCTIVNQGHLRQIELSIEIPRSPLEAVCSHETWEEIYERLAELIATHRTTLIFVNTRRMCERLAQQLSKRLGEERVTSHHGSLSRAQRLAAEERLKSGSLSALVATASLELGIDIGSVDLVCQIGVTSSIGTLLQRVGRSGHSLSGISRGKLFALTFEELMTAAALASAVRRGHLDVLHVPDKPLDILAQQIVAAAATQDWSEDELFDLVRRAHHYRNLERAEFDEVVRMIADGYSSRRGRAGALIGVDAVGKRIHARRGARLTAITSGGAIPDTADYQVLLEPQGLVVGTLNEDFAVESTPGDIFQLGNTSWKVLKIEPGRVRVEDAHGQPPSIPFWLGEAPARTDELSQEITRLRHEIERRLVGPASVPAGIDAGPTPAGRDAGPTSAIDWVMAECGLEQAAAAQLCDYLAETQRALGALPTTDSLILERFFDESGGMQLVLHAPFGRRVNWAWGLALRKRFCRGFNFELQAAASENALLLSLGPQHSFPLGDVFRYLHSSSMEKLLVQAALEAPVFQTRWRWDACRSLALLRFSGGKKVPAPLMRMRSDDLLAAVFPHASACPENLEGDREIPDHPLVREVLHDCLHEAMDSAGLAAILRRIESGEMTLIARDTTEPSSLARDILTAKPYAFLDDAPLEERRTQAVQMRRGLSREDAAGIGALDANAIARVREEARPDLGNADELHDVLMLHGFLTESEAHPHMRLLEELAAAGRATLKAVGSRQEAVGSRQEADGRRQEAAIDLWIATERVPLFEAIFPGLATEPSVQVPERERAKTWTRESALAEIVRGRLEMLGPVTVAELAGEIPLSQPEIEQALFVLESTGAVLRGNFSPPALPSADCRLPPADCRLPTASCRLPTADCSLPAVEWCDRRLLARIHRYTLERLRREIEPLSAADYMRFLISWQHLDPATQLEGPQGAREAIAQLQGFEIAAAAWEREVLASRVRKYERKWLDQLSLSGEVTWGRRFPPAVAQASSLSEGTDRLEARLTTGRASGQVRNAPIGLFLREQLEEWLALAPPLCEDPARLSGAARDVLAQLRKRGAVFFLNLVRESKRLPAEVEQALGELVAAGLATCDGFGGLRALLISPARREKIKRYRRYMALRPGAGEGEDQSARIQSAGRWSLFRGEPGLFAMGMVGPASVPASSIADRRDASGIATPEQAEFVARQLLRRWGVVFHRVILREPGLPPWREILRVFRRLEARGEIRGGRFVAGFSGEQYALPQAVEHLRAIGKQAPNGKPIAVCGADPLNLVGIVTPGERVAARASSRIVYRDGLPVAIREAGQLRVLVRDPTPAAAREIADALSRRAM